METLYRSQKSDRNHRKIGKRDFVKKGIIKKEEYLIKQRR
jgi:hypothetical protein